MRKTLLLVALFQMAFFCLLAQNNVPPVDKSPMDMSYFPVNYPVLKFSGDWLKAEKYGDWEPMKQQKLSFSGR